MKIKMGLVLFRTPLASIVCTKNHCNPSKHLTLWSTERRRSHSRVVPINNSIVYQRYSEISMRANVFVDSQDDIRLILQLIFFIIIIIIIIRQPIIIGLSNCYFTSAPHFTHMRNWVLRRKYSSAVRALCAFLHFCHQDCSRTAEHPPSTSRQFLRPRRWCVQQRMRKVNIETSQVELVVLHTLLRLSILWKLCETEQNGTWNVKYTCAFRFLLLKRTLNLSPHQNWTAGG